LSSRATPVRSQAHFAGGFAMTKKKNMGNPEQISLSNQELEKNRSKEEEMNDKLENALSVIFAEKKTGQERIEEIITKTGPYLKEKYMGETAEDIKARLKKCEGIEDENEFVQRIKEILQPVIDFKLSKPEEFEEIARKEFIDNGKFTPVNEMIAYGEGDDGWLHIHIAPHETSSIKEKLRLFKEGMKKLAEMAKKDENIKGLTGTSWIIAEFPKALERFGFTLTGEISDELRESHFKNEKRTIHGAQISREELIEKYL